MAAPSRAGALLAAALVEGAAGLLAGVLLNLLGAGHEAPAVFALLALAGVASDIVLVPGWVWAGAARNADGRSPEEGPPRADLRAYLHGGALGVLPILALAAVASVTGETPERIVPRSWPLLPALAPLALVLAALPHNLMVLRGSPVRPAPARALRRAAILAAPLLALAAGAAFLTPAGRDPVGHRSPDGRLAVLAWSDTNFGQIERLRVMADPGTPAARRIFDHVGDVPLRVLRWRDAGTAELEAAPHDGEGARRLLLTCEADVCRLEAAPEP